MTKRKEHEPEKDAPPVLEVVLAAAGVNVDEARSRIVTLADIYPQGIPESVMNRWADEYLNGRHRAIALAVGRAWEKGA